LSQQHFVPRFALLAIILALFSCLIIANAAAAATTADFSVFPTSIKQGDELVTVTWSGIKNATFGDVVLFYVVPETALSGPLPIKDGIPEKKQIGFFKVFELDPQLTGSGQVQMPVFLSREYAFWIEYSRINGDSQKEILHWASVTDSHYYVCSAFHLAYTHRKEEYKLMYTTSESSSAPHWIHLATNYDTISAPSVALKNSTTDGFFPTIHSGTYTLQDMVESPANQTANWISPGNFREAVLRFPTDQSQLFGSDKRTSKLHDTPQRSLYYWYRVRDQNGIFKSQIYKVYSPFGLESPTSNYRHDTDVYLFGDSGTGFPWGFYTSTDQQQTAVLTYNTIAMLIDEKRANSDFTPTHILHIGDLNYSRGYSFLTEYFVQQIEPLASANPYMISIGNHEYCYRGQPWKPDWHNCGTDSGGEAGIPTFRRWAMPKDFQYQPYNNTNNCVNTQETQGYIRNKMRNIAYSYNVNHIHFIVMNMELDFTTGSAQFEFVEKDLKSVDRKQTPWVILSGHRPAYCTSQECEIAEPDNPLAMDVLFRNLYQPLMVKYNVNIAIFGHAHHYERFKPLGLTNYKPILDYNVNVMGNGKEEYLGYEDTIDFNEVNYQYENVQTRPVTRVVDGVDHIKSIAPIHIVSGAAGNEYNPPWAKYMRGIDGGYSDYHHMLPPHSVFRTQSFGFSHFRANQTHLTGKWFSNEHGSIHDHFVLENQF